MPRKPPRPCEPTTTSCAFSDCSTSARTARSRVTTRVTATSGYSPAKPAWRSASRLSCSDSRRSQSSLVSEMPAAAAWTCGSIQVWTQTRPTPRAEASANAHAVALVLISEPSTPTTTGSVRDGSQVSSRVTTIGQ